MDKNRKILISLGVISGRLHPHSLDDDIWTEFGLSRADGSDNFLASAERYVGGLILAMTKTDPEPKERRSLGEIMSDSLSTIGTKMGSWEVEMTPEGTTICATVLATRHGISGYPTPALISNIYDRVVVDIENAFDVILVSPNTLEGVNMTGTEINLKWTFRHRS